MLGLTSSASTKPRVVTIKAVSFKCRGMVIRRMAVGGMLLEMMNPAKILPISRRLIQLIRRGLSSLIGAEGEEWGCPSSAKKIIRVL